MSWTNVPRDKLMAAIANVETLCGWLEQKMFDAKYPAHPENVQSIAESALGIKPPTGSTPA